MLLLLLSRFSRVRLCETPEAAAHQASPSQGFSRQEHWSVLPFPSPMHESEKWKGSRSVVSNSSSRPHGLQSSRLLCPWDFSSKSAGVGCHCLLPHGSAESAFNSSDFRSQEDAVSVEVVMSNNSVKRMPHFHRSDINHVRWIIPT